MQRDLQFLLDMLQFGRTYHAELTRGQIGKEGKGLNNAQIVQNFQAIKGTIRAYTNYTLKAFKNISSANINKVT